MSPKPLPDVVLRAATPQDSSVCGQICFDAFSSINSTHGFPCDFPSPEAAMGLLSMLFSSPGFYSVVAESGGRIVGSNCLDERSVVKGIGPITIATDAQNCGLGRRLMEAVMDRARDGGAAGVRLVQTAFHNRSLSLYASLGFVVREPLACMQGRTTQPGMPGCEARPAQPGDIDACNALSHRVHGFVRGAELAQAIQNGTARVVERAGRITGYATDLAFFGHATAETNTDLQSLIASVESFGGPGILVPSRNASLFSWCLANGLRVVQPMTLMTVGLYNEPAGAWFPSVLY
ncbi:MAG: GNAT family N-acetyltransferase [Acidobacteriota bacterium]|nr:GNAT family N-acetyltransferase [Acidobacteriota bacterium]